MQPPFAADMALAAACRTQKAPVKSTSITRRHSSSDIFKIVRSRVIPALLTSTSKRPHRSTARSTNRRTASRSDTSAWARSASPPDARTAAAADSAFSRFLS